MLSRFLTWLLSWFHRGSADLYHADERLIFKFFNGVKWVHGDPLVLYRRLMDVAPVLSVDIKVAQSESNAAAIAHANVLKMTREIFGVEPPSGPIDCRGTLSETQLQILLDEFLMYTDDVKKNSRPNMICAEVPLPTGKSSPAGSQPTPSSSDSGSTVAEASISSPMPSPSEQVSLSGL